MLPKVIMHSAMSLDGRVDWLGADQGSMARFYEIAMRWGEDATLVGADTILAAMGSAKMDETGDPKPGDSQPPDLDSGDRRPLLVIPDSRGRIRTWSALRIWPYWRDAVALVSTSTPEEYLEHLKKLKVKYIVAGDGHVNIRMALEALSSEYGVHLIRIDSGGTLTGVMLRDGLVDEVSVVVHPCLIGGLSPESIFRAGDLTTLGGVIKLRLKGVDLLDEDEVHLSYEVVK